MPARGILVVGSTNTDMVVDTPRLPAPGETVIGGQFRMEPGGKGANQAMAAARAGGRVAFVTAIGNDAFGTGHRRRFLHEGIDVAHLRVKGAPTGTALILVGPRGENLIAVAPGANAALTPDDLIAAAPAFSEAGLLILQLEIPLESACWAVEYAHRLHLPVLLNPAPMPPDGLPNALLRHVEILTPNEGELRALAPEASTLDEAALSVLARGPQAVIVTRGPQGAVSYNRDGIVRVPAFTVAAVDTVGAGDCFSATLGVALAEGRVLAEAVRFAAAAAALSTTRPGAQAAMPKRDEIERLLDQEALA